MIKNIGILTLSFLLSFQQNINEMSTASLSEPPSVQIVMVGDMLMHERVIESGKKEDGTYNFDHFFVNVNDTGKYSVRYSVEGESGLKSDMIMLVLVDILPEGMEYRESAGAENEGSS